MAGIEDITGKLKAGTELNGKRYKVHLDGHSMIGHITKGEKSPREGFIYWTDEGDVAALRVDNWKAVFMEQRCQGTLQIWFEPFVTLRAPKLFNLRTDPYEMGDITSNTYWNWYFEHAYILVPMQGIIAGFLETLKEFPPSQKAGSFNLEKVLDTMNNAASGSA